MFCPAQTAAWLAAARGAGSGFSGCSEPRHSDGRRRAEVIFHQHIALHGQPASARVKPLRRVARTRLRAAVSLRTRPAPAPDRLTAVSLRTRPVPERLTAVSLRRSEEGESGARRCGPVSVILRRIQPAVARRGGHGIPRQRRDRARRRGGAVAVLQVQPQLPRPAAATATNATRNAAACPQIDHVRLCLTTFDCPHAAPLPMAGSARKSTMFD